MIKLSQFRYLAFTEPNVGMLRDNQNPAVRRFDDTSDRPQSSALRYASEPALLDEGDFPRSKVTFRPEGPHPDTLDCDPRFRII